MITGLGVRTPLGSTPDELWQRLLGRETAAQQWEDLIELGLPIPVACRVTDPTIDSDRAARGRSLGIAAATDAARSAAIDAGTRVGLFVGTTLGESGAIETQATSDSFDWRACRSDLIVDAIADELELTGPRRTYGSACAAGNYAIGAAADAVRSGLADIVIAGGVEPFSPLAMVGFARSRAMTPDLCRPFDAERAGMQVGEAAAFLVIERREVAEQRGATILASVTGLGLSGDAYHPVAPRPDGSGMAEAIVAGLNAARLDPSEVGWVCAHGTGTSRSDAAESKAISDIFGSHTTPVSSLKGALGHSMGAATAVEAAVGVLALRHRTIPPTANVRVQDPALTVDLVTEPRPSPDLHAIVSCGFAFGGLNSALVLEAQQSEP